MTQYALLQRVKATKPLSHADYAYIPSGTQGSVMDFETMGGDLWYIIRFDRRPGERWPCREDELASVEVPA